MQKRCEKEWNVLSSGEPSGAHDRPGIGKCASMHSVVALPAAAGVAPHANRNRIARQRQRLPSPQWNHRKRLEQPASAAHPPKRITANLDPTVLLKSRRKTGCAG